MSTTKAKKANDNLPFSEWIDQEPPVEELEYNGDGSAFIPIATILRLLNELSRFGKLWSTSNFTFDFSRADKYFFVSASVTLSISEPSGFARTFVGAATFPVSSSDENMNYAASALSEATKNAAKKLGRRFGSDLNKDLVKDDLVREGLPKAVAGLIEIQKMKIARESNDEQTIRELESNYIFK